MATGASCVRFVRCLKTALLIMLIRLFLRVCDGAAFNVTFIHVHV